MISDREITLRETSVTIRVVYDDPSRRQWAEYLASMAERILKAYEMVTAVDFKTAAALYINHLPIEEQSTIKIVGKDQVFLNGKWIGAYNNTSGIFGEPRGIFVEYNYTPISDPALIFHELGHFWFFQIPWLNEGIVSYLPLVLARNKILNLNESEYENIINHWGGNFVQVLVDEPTITDFRSNADSVLAWYCKTFKIQYIINKELGDDVYLEFLRRCLAFDGKSTTDDVITLLTEFKALNWRGLLSGWVFPGNYTKYNWALFQTVKF